MKKILIIKNKKLINFAIAFIFILAIAICVSSLFPSFSCSQEQEFHFVKIQQEQQDELITQTENAQLALLFTGSTRGNFEPCGCGGIYQGGLSRRATVIDKIRHFNHNTILLDTGDITVGGSKIQFEFLAQAYNKLHYNAIALGEGDIRVGIKSFCQITKKYNIPFISSNLQIKSEDKKNPSYKNLLPKYRIIKIAGKKIAIISVIARRWLAILPMKIRKQLKFTAPTKAINQMKTHLTGKCDFLILLSHLGPGERQNISNALDGIDLWIDNGGHQWVRNRSQSTDFEKNIFLTRIPPLLISWKNDRKIGLAAINFSKHLKITNAGLITIEKHIPQEPAFLEIYDAYRYAVRQKMLTRIYSQYHPLPTTQLSTSFKYVPSSVCAKCHSDIYKFWKHTPHAHAFATLIKAHRDDDPNCWACHTTGFRSKTGFVNPKLTPHLENVGCQTCHKINLQEHIKNNGKMSDRQKKISLITRSWHCRRCHVPHRSPNFDYKTYLNEISCKHAKKTKQQ